MHMLIALPLVSMARSKVLLYGLLHLIIYCALVAQLGVRKKSRIQACFYVGTSFEFSCWKTFVIKRLMVLFQGIFLNLLRLDTIGRLCRSVHEKTIMLLSLL